MTAPTPFAQWLRGQLDERDWGVRTLARRMNPEEPEIARRALNRYLAGGFPTQAYRVAIAGALGIDEREVPGSGEGVPSDPFRGGGGHDGRRGAARVGRV
ncbi:MAG: hypothetical protein NUW01_13805, partial [Gemmatimonadaceae bacterium]|nr:hypothetical protein [Gemmatimonadaceae bacterium]